jgi:hypothetical protein
LAPSGRTFRAAIGIWIGLSLFFWWESSTHDQLTINIIGLVVVMTALITPQVFPTGVGPNNNNTNNSNDTEQVNG